MNSTAMGNAFQQWGIGFTAMVGYRLHLDRTETVNNQTESMQVTSEVSTLDKKGVPIRLDCKFASKTRKDDLVAEFKWTIGDPQKKLKLAFDYLCKAHEGGDKLIIVGSASQALDKASVDKLLTQHAAAYRQVFYRKDASGGTCVMRYVSDTHKLLTVVNIVPEDDLATKWALALAMLLAEPESGGTDGGKNQEALLKLGSSCFIPILRNLTDPPKMDGNGLKHDISKVLPPSGFVLDPWSYLLQCYLETQQARKPTKHRWVRLLCQAISTPINLYGIGGAPSEKEMANRIPPLPLRCGKHHNMNVVREFADVIPSTNADGQDQARIRIVRGAAGTGKSTLLEHLYVSHIEQLWRGGAAGPRVGLPVFIDLQRDAEKLRFTQATGGDAFSHVTVMEALTGCEQNQPWKLGAKQDDASTLAALLTRFQIYLYVDGYDQLAIEEQNGLRLLGLRLRQANCEIAYLLMSSRPGHDELLAFDWEKTFINASIPNMGATLSLSSPEMDDVRKYCQDWLDTLKGLVNRPQEGESLNLDAGEFLRWLHAVEAPDVANDVNSDAIQRNPLMLAMALAIYIKRLFSPRLRSHQIIQTQADLIETLIMELSDAYPDHGENARKGGNVTGGLALLDEKSRSLLELACYESLRKPGRTVGRIDADSLELARSAMNYEVDDIRRIRHLPFIQASLTTGEAFGPIDFVHPLFHEYLAANCFSQQLCQAVVPKAQMNPQIFAAHPLIRLHIGEKRRIVISDLGEVIVNLGRDAFKYLMGRLLWHYRNSPLHRPIGTGLEVLLNLLFEDYGIQQYLYDAGYVDRCAAELEFIDQNQWVHGNGLRCAEKLIAHKYYGSKGELEQGIVHMLLIADYLTKTKGPLARWYAIFCVDHIENRFFRIQFEDMFILLTQRRQIKDHQSDIQFENQTGFQAWMTATWRKLTHDLAIFSPIAQLDMAQAMSMQSVPEPNWPKERQFLLRAAHYWGHVGNRQLHGQTSNAKVDLYDERNLALQAYARAVVYRLISMVMSLQGMFVDDIWTILQNDAFPPWFAIWLAKQQKNGAAELAQSGATLNEIASFERFVGPAQAIADTANQYSCRADVLVWNALHAKTDAERAAAMVAAEAEKKTADALWLLARSDKIKGFQGEGLLRYFLHGAGVEERLRLLRRRQSGEAVEDAAIVRARVSHLLESLEKEYGMSYALAWEDVLVSTEAFRKVLANPKPIL